jgi:uncharacterized protein with FMN-binding domain
MRSETVGIVVKSHIASQLQQTGTVGYNATTYVLLLFCIFILIRMIQNSPSQTNRGAIPMSVLAIGAAVIIAVGAMVFINYQSQKELSKLPPVVTPTAAPNPPSSATKGDAMVASEGAMTASNGAMMSTYKNGSYEAMGHYTSPNGPETIDIKVTIKDGIITDTTAIPQATFPKSQNFQGLFTNGYKPLVVGKKLDEVKLDKVSGSSLTPKGFNDAIEQIKAQAKAQS